MPKKILKSFLVFLFAGYSQYACCQSDTDGAANSKNTVTAELFGHSRSLISVNYERLTKPFKEYFIFSLRTGIGYSPGLEVDEERKLKGITAIPVVASLLVGGYDHYVQLGIGYTASFGEDYVDTTVNPEKVYQKFESAYIVSLGYRYMEVDGLTAQAYPMLVWSDNPSSKFSFSFGVALGYAF